MNFMDVIYNDTGNAKGISTVLFVSGCTNNCSECHNPQSHDFLAGSEYTKEVEDKIIESLKNPHVRNLVISGGDPCHPNNFETVKALIRRTHLETNARVIIYTGYEVIENSELASELYNVLAEYDLIIDGPYMKEKKTKIRDYRGSTNQRAILVEKYEGRVRIIHDYFLEDLQVVK